ncbi:MAG TPA: 16S rRNA (cytosine(967)-C(5))-methyltransferase RsmB [Candidatus Cloacimonadota bacterium]|nr:16S rRNA (cytosine(967)-C(5))-methyltransferase RsmB [Candidatus Cloacimonadota bacterium]HPT71826.1 16S rRNA (cytosine(967)-C(5))-methyltransferase RsmB [Candidatus Cloacimonadota bacterium]
MNIRLEAYQISIKVLKNNDYADNLLQQSCKKLSDTNENLELLYRIVKGIVKMQGNLEYICSQYTEPDKFSKTDLKIKALLYLGFFQLLHLDSIPEHAAVNETVEIAKKLYGEKTADFVNAVLRAYLRNPQIQYPADNAEKIAAMYSYPVDLIRKWLQLWGEEETEFLCMYYNEPAKLHIRVNNLATGKSKLIEYFRKRGVEFQVSPASPNILITTHAPQVLQDVAFSEGYFTVQDTSAALVVELLDPRENDSVLDLFAAPGGKATYIAERMNNTGEVIAVDKIPSKVKLIKQNMNRLQIDNMILITEDAFHYGPVAPAFDRVLLDVPCSGWGVFGRKPDLRWQYHQNIEELLKIQANALNLGASFVKPGGYLVYSTCTMNPQENEEQVNRFLKANQQFELVQAKDFIPADYTRDGMMHTFPNIHNMDGAFAAKMRKKAKER